MILLLPWCYSGHGPRGSGQWEPMPGGLFCHRVLYKVRLEEMIALDEAGPSQLPGGTLLRCAYVAAIA